MSLETQQLEHNSTQHEINWPTEFERELDLEDDNPFRDVDEETMIKKTILIDGLSNFSESILNINKQNLKITAFPIVKVMESTQLFDFEYHFHNLSTAEEQFFLYKKLRNLILRDHLYYESYNKIFKKFNLNRVKTKIIIGENYKLIFPRWEDEADYYVPACYYYNDIYLFLEKNNSKNLGRKYLRESISHEMGHLIKDRFLRCYNFKTKTNNKHYTISKILQQDWFITPKVLKNINNPRHKKYFDHVAPYERNKEKFRIKKEDCLDNWKSDELFAETFAIYYKLYKSKKPILRRNGFRHLHELYPNTFTMIESYCNKNGVNKYKQHKIKPISKFLKLKNN